MLLRFWTLSDVVEGEYGLVSSIAEDYPHVSEPGADTGYTVAEAKVAYGWTHNVDNRTIGRDDDGEVVWVKLSSIPTYHNEVTTEGIRSQSDILAVDKAGIQLGIVDCVADHTVAAQINSDPDHELLAGVLHSSEDPDEVPPALAAALEEWHPDVPFTAERLISLRDFLVARGVPLAWLQEWASDNPGATPRKFYTDLRSWAIKQ